ncbi:putative Histidine kinase [Candidatus Terasakiella magnetica]|uniref:histidine kinase n=1 Tax=Candidatus Terasakiella magnetica TaxID=1867952 RepID=A0A1C3RJ21_9PROT|nr:sensor histidine kinase [Candidatus Terasakiella magnetica]SCA57258.1 putative Histidine kinase [Candidatus Terasakiella magnetica]
MVRKSRAPSIFIYPLRYVLPIGIAFMVALWFAGSQFLEMTLRDQLDQHMKEIGILETDTIQERLDDLQEFARAISENELTINGIIDRQGNASYLPAFFRSLSLPGSPAGVMYLVDYKGRLIASHQSDAFDMENVPSYYDMESLILDKHGIVIVQPVYYAGSAEGAIVLKYPIEAFDEIFERNSFSNEVFIINGRGRVIYSSNTELAGLGTIPDENLEGWVQVKNKLFVNNTGVIVASSLEEAARSLRTFQIIQLAGLVIFLSLAVGLVVLCAYLISRPLNGFAKSIASVSDMDGLTIRLETQGPREIEHFANAFNHMAGKLENALQEQTELQKELQQAQKLEAIGQLAGGIAHEINTPSQYIGDNLSFLLDSEKDLIGLINQTVALKEECKEHGICRERVERIDRMIEDIDLEFLVEETGLATQQSLDGIKQISSIVLAMKEFSHPGSKEKKMIDLNHALETTLTVSKNEWKNLATIENEMDQSLPHVLCHAGELNQVFLNLIVNAAHAIEEAGRGGEGRITVSTQCEADMVEVRIKDNGNGIKTENKNQIFNPFFTTKEVGRGTGQGLSLSHDIVVNKHNGSLSFETQEGVGSSFIVRLPCGEMVAKEQERDSG